MKPTLEVGTVGRLSGVVRDSQTITLGDDPNATVFSTPSMIHLMEHAAREALRPHLEEHEESVGIDVQVKHTSATPPGNKVAAEATVTAVEKNVVEFDLVARDQWGEIGRGTHRRAVIRTEGFAARLTKDKPAAADRRGQPLPACETILLQQQGRMLQATLHRPTKRNAINAQLTAEMESLVDWLDSNHHQVGVVVLTGSSETFCAGDDVSDLKIENRQECEELSLRRGELYQRMTRVPQVFVAAIHGLAVGGGFVCACACDLRIATHQATLGLPEVKLGWPPNYGQQIVQSLIGRGNLLHLSLTGATIDARRAQQLGIVHQVVAASQLMPVAETMAKRILALPPDAVAHAKRLLAVSSSATEGGDATAAFMQCLNTPAAKESIQRFSSS